MFHSVLIIGYDDDKQEVCYYDYWIRDGGSEHKLSYDLLNKGINSYLKTEKKGFNLKYYYLNDKFSYGEYVHCPEKEIIRKINYFYKRNYFEKNIVNDYIKQLKNIIEYDEIDYSCFFRELFYTIGLELLAFKGVDIYILEKFKEYIPEYMRAIFLNIHEKYGILYNTILKAKCSCRKRDAQKIVEVLSKITRLEEGFIECE